MINDGRQGGYCNRHNFLRTYCTSSTSSLIFALLSPLSPPSPKRSEDDCTSLDGVEVEVEVEDVFFLGDRVLRTVVWSSPREVTSFIKDLKKVLRPKQSKYKMLNVRY